jgi:hypothetical protein
MDDVASSFGSDVGWRSSNLCFHWVCDDVFGFGVGGEAVVVVGFGFCTRIWRVFVMRWLQGGMFGCQPRVCGRVCRLRREGLLRSAGEGGVRVGRARGEILKRG